MVFCQRNEVVTKEDRKYLSHLNPQVKQAVYFISPHVYACVHMCMHVHALYACVCVYFLETNDSRTECPKTTYTYNDLIVQVPQT